MLSSGDNYITIRVYDASGNETARGLTVTYIP
jgi:hypothetical protein